MLLLLSLLGWIPAGGELVACLIDWLICLVDGDRST